MTEQSLGLLAVGSEESSGGVRSPEQIRRGANTGLFCLAVVALLCRQPWFTRVIAKVLHQFTLVRLAGRSATAASMCLWRETGKERDISAHPSGQRIKTCICTGEWKGAQGMCWPLLAKRNKIVVEDQMLGCSKSSMASALDWRSSSSCGAPEGHHKVEKFISLVIKRYPVWLLFQPYHIGCLHLLARADPKSEGPWVRWALVLSGICHWGIRTVSSAMCLASLSVDQCCSKN